MLVAEGTSAPTWVLKGLRDLGCRYLSAEPEIVVRGKVKRGFLIEHTLEPYGDKFYTLSDHEPFMEFCVIAMPALSGIRTMKE